MRSVAWLLVAIPLWLPATAGRAQSLAVGGFHTCAVSSDTTVWCWGLNSAGQLGVSNLAQSPLPVQVPGLMGVRSIHAGSENTCAVLDDGSLWCWGGNGFGQLGVGDNAPRSGPVRPLALPSVQSASVGGNFVCALAVSGEGFCWGRNWNGQLGVGTTLGTWHLATPVAGGFRFSSISAGGDHTCAVRVDGQLVCWGDNSQRALGFIGFAGGTPTAVPELPGALAPAQAVSSGGRATCALGGSGVFCWGGNSWGQTGQGSQSPWVLPAPSPTLVGAQQAAAGNDHACARVSGRAYCWGRNSAGQLGLGVIDTQRDAPALVPGLVGVVEVAAGGNHSCVRRNNDSVWCWGSNDFGQLGTGDAVDRSSPVQVIVNPDEIFSNGFE